MSEIDLGAGAGAGAAGAGAGAGAAGDGAGAGNGAASSPERQGAADARHAAWQSARDERERAANAEPQRRQSSEQPAEPPKAADQKAAKIALGEGVELTAEEARDLVARDAAARSKALQRPQTAEAYKAELPADFKPPDGLNFQFIQNDPLLAQARAIAHAECLSQEGFSRLLAVYAGSQILSEQTVNTARNAEIAKLGAAGPSRFASIETFLKAQLGEAAGAQIASRIFVASDVEAFEKLVAKFTSQGGASFNGTGREPPKAPGRASNEEIAAMSPAQRLDYSRQFDQSTMRPWRDPRGG